jgi:hypothetical protein
VPILSRRQWRGEIGDWQGLRSHHEGARVEKSPGHVADRKKAILFGTGKMKPVAGITDKQGDDIVAYVKTLK